MVSAPWHTPDGREARNEQRKLRAAIANAIAIAFFIAGPIAPLVNPALADLLEPQLRIGMFVGAGGLHLLACWFVRDMEDRP